MSKILICFNCKFKKTLKDELVATLIIRNHNETRDPWEHHILSIVNDEELKSVNSLPFYDGIVYRGVCVCNTILDRKTQKGLDHAMAMHLLTGEETNLLRDKTIEHDFNDNEYDKHNKNIVVSKTPRTFQIKRSDYIAKNPTDEIRLKEHMARYNIQQEQLSTETGLATFDQNLFWLGTRSFSFNWLNNMLFSYFRVYNCQRCGEHSFLGWDAKGLDYTNIDKYKQFETFKELYWHFYREHYLNSGTLKDNEHYDALRRELEYAMLNRRDEIKTLLEIGEQAAKSGIKIDDTAISMLQQLVLVEIALHKRKKFNYDRASNALYQLNRVHGISADDLRSLFFPKGSRGQTGERLFHGMVWTENKAPDWFDSVVKTLGDKMQI